MNNETQNTPTIYDKNERFNARSKANDLSEMERAETYVKKLLFDLMVVFPNSKSLRNDPEFLGAMVKQWAIALMENKIRTGVHLDVEAGLSFARQADTSYMPSVGTFIAWCSITEETDKARDEALRRFNSGRKPKTVLDRQTRAQCGFDAKRMPARDSNKLFLETYDKLARQGVKPEPLAIEGPKTNNLTGLTPERQKEVNAIGIARLKALFN